MHPSRTESSSGQLTLEVGRWSASVWSIAATVVAVLLIVLLAKSTLTNNARADDWQQRAEEEQRAPHLVGHEPARTEAHRVQIRACR